MLLVTIDDLGLSHAVNAAAARILVFASAASGVFLIGVGRMQEELATNLIEGGSRLSNGDTGPHWCQVLNQRFLASRSRSDAR